LVKELPSKIAAVSVYASLLVFKNSSSNIWTSLLAKHTTYRESDIKVMASDLLLFVKKIETSQLKTIHMKFLKAKNLEVAKLIE
jgi:hypothetical protein